MKMYKKNDRKYLYWIIEMYLSGNINEEVFCERFHDSFGVEIDSRCFSIEEEKIFEDLNSIVRRFSSVKEDLKQYPGFFYNEKQLRDKVTETQKKLNKTLNEVIEEELSIPDPFLEKSATILDDQWLMCPDCVDAWESNSKNAMVICPKCNQILHNPRWQG
ncbi:MAG: colicin immunity domain-containing protein [Simkaniaceae bacterium]